MAIILFINLTSYVTIVPTYYNNYVYTVESVASTIADKEEGIEPPIFIITIVYTNRINIAITIFITIYKLVIFREITYIYYIN